MAHPASPVPNDRTGPPPAAPVYSDVARDGGASCHPGWSLRSERAGAYTLAAPFVIGRYSYRVTKAIRSAKKTPGFSDLRPPAKPSLWYGRAAVSGGPERAQTATP